MDYVEAVLTNVVQISCTSQRLRDLLLSNGAIADNDTFHLRLTFDSKHQLASILSQLQGLDFPFSNQPAGWPPAAVFLQLRDDHLVQGSIKTIVWHGPQKNPSIGAA